MTYCHIPGYLNPVYQAARHHMMKQFVGIATVKYLYNEFLWTRILYLLQWNFIERQQKQIKKLRIFVHVNPFVSDTWHTAYSLCDAEHTTVVHILLW